jgi:hypothetical protein
MATVEVTKRAYVAPTLERMPIGATAASNNANSDDNVTNNNAFVLHS